MFAGLFHSGGDLGFPKKVNETDYFFELIGDVKFRFGHGLQVLFCWFAHGQEGIAIFEDGALRFFWQAPFSMAGILDDLVFEVGVNEWNGNRELQLKIIDLKLKN